MLIIYLKNSSYNKFILEPTPLVEENINAESKINYEEIVNNVKEEYKNDDIVGILEINNTDYIVPLLQGLDNDYYLNHNFNKEYNIAGWIFADYRNKFDNTDKNIVIYGHNMKEGSMFGTLENTFFYFIFPILVM